MPANTSANLSRNTRFVIEDSHLQLYSLVTVVEASSLSSVLSHYELAIFLTY